MREKIIKLLRSLVPAGTLVAVSVPEDDQFGHYTTNVAFALAKAERAAPLAVAERLAGELIRREKGLFVRVEAKAPGFVNIWLVPDALQHSVIEIVKRGAKFGASRALARERIQAEFVSANPTGPLTLANGRGGFLGDALANVLAFAGARVEREYYVNDTGNQIAALGKSLAVALGLNLGQRAPDEKLYQGEYVKAWAAAHARYVEQWKNNPMKLGEAAARDFLKSIKQTLAKKAHIRFDRFTSEKRIYQKKYPTRALAFFKKKNVVYEKDGAIWLKTTAYGDDKDRVLITSNGEPTYFLADAGHYLETKQRGFTTKINILGPDHYGYKARIQVAAQLLGLKRSEVIITQALLLVRGGKEVKMSKRRGEFVTFEEMVDEVGADAARFLSLSISPDTHINFDLDLAKERSMKNPVYYAQYAYVRAKGILKKLKTKNLKLKTLNKKTLTLLNTPEDARLMLKLLEFPAVVEDTARDYQAHRLSRYALELARAFHNFYEKERIVGETSEVARARAALVNATEIVLKNLFSLLGISAPEKM